MSNAEKVARAVGAGASVAASALCLFYLCDVMFDGAPRRKVGEVIRPVRAAWRREVEARRAERWTAMEANRVVFEAMMILEDHQ